MPNESAEKREEKPWYEVTPYCSKWLNGCGENYNIPAIIAEAQRIERQRIKEIVEKERSQYDKNPRYRLNLEWGDAYKRACDNILNRLSQDKPKP